MAISPRWFLTAAHCGHDAAGNKLNPGQIVFRRYPRSAKSLTASEVVVHPDFTTDTATYDPSGHGTTAPWDVMLVKTQRDIGLSSHPDLQDPGQAFKRAWWPTSVYGRNPRAKVIGFGAMNVDAGFDRTGPTEGQVEMTRCQTLYPSEIWEKGFENICSYKREGYLDYGDSGGPLVFEHDGVESIIGINTYVRDNELLTGTRSRSFLATHELMSLHRIWIQQTIQSDQSRPGRMTLNLSNDWGSPCRINVFDSSQGLAYFSTSQNSDERGVGAVDDRAAFQWQIPAARTDTLSLSGNWINTTVVVRCEDPWE